MTNYNLVIIGVNRTYERLVTGAQVIPREGESGSLRGDKGCLVDYVVTNVNHSISDTKKVSTRFSSGDVIAKARIPTVTAREKELESKVPQ